MLKMTKGYNFVKSIKTTINPNSHAHLQILMRHSAKFQVNSIKDVAGDAGTRSESARALTPSKMGETNIEKHMHTFIS